MLGRALREVLMLVIQAVIITVLAVPFGLRVNVGYLLLAYVLLALLSLMAVSVAYGVTMRLRHAAALGPISCTGSGFSRSRRTVGGANLPPLASPT